MPEAERWQECEAMDHVGPERDATVQWRDLGLMCDACFAAYGDTRPLQQQLREAMTDDVDELRAFGREHGLAALLDHIGLDEFGNEVIRLHRQLAEAVEERDRMASALEWAKRSNWIPTRAEVNTAREALGLPPLRGQ